MTRPALPIAAGMAALVWLAGWLWIGRHAMLDDALIHLRYAQELAQTGALSSFDGATPSYGASSPLYVLLLAALVPVFTTPLLPKALAVGGYLLLLGLAVAPALRRGGPRAGWAALALVLLAPMGQRWLTDGMETGLVGASTLLLARVALQDEAERKSGSMALLFFLGMALVLLRVELSLALFFAVLGAACVRPWRHTLRHLTPLALGGLAGLGALLLAFGHLLPDTAVAKQMGPVTLPEAVLQVGRSTLASLSFGAGLATLWAVTLAVGLRRGNSAQKAALLVTNLLFPAVVALIAARGQILHGVRHLLWVYLFLIAWNLRTLAGPGSPGLAAPPRSAPGRAVLAAACAALAVLWSFEAPVVAGILRSRSEIFDAMRGQHLERLSEATGAAYDVGFIAWFSHARLWDASGLVNGRAAATMTAEERIRRIGEAQPDFLFVTSEQAASFARSLPLETYRICHRYRSMNLAGPQVHLLAVRSPWVEALNSCQESRETLGAFLTASHGASLTTGTAP